MITLTLNLPAGVSFVSLHHSAYNAMYHVCVMGKRENGRDETAVGTDSNLQNAAYIAVERLMKKLTEAEYDPRHWVANTPFPHAGKKPAIDVGELDL